MPICDICAAEGRGAVIPAQDFKQAVSGRGFNPFKLGLVNVPNLKTPEENFETWRRMVDANDTDWLLCDRCYQSYPRTETGFTRVSGVLFAFGGLLVGAALTFASGALVWNLFSGWLVLPAVIGVLIILSTIHEKIRVLYGIMQACFYSYVIWLFGGAKTPPLMTWCHGFLGARRSPSFCSSLLANGKAGS